MLPTLLDDIELDEVDKDLSWLTKQKKSTPQLIFVTENIPSATHALVIPHTHANNITLFHFFDNLNFGILKSVLV